MRVPNGTARLKNVNNSLNTNNFLLLRDILWSKFLSIFKWFLMPVLISYPWQLKTVIFLNLCLTHSVPLSHIAPTQPRSVRGNNL